MKKYKIYKNKKPITLSDEQIEKYKNFDTLFVSYKDITKRQKLPIYKNKKIFLFLILLALAAYILSYFS
tara:strand:+ start:614 stop:820 length:207 start_codon:yes stop_codon:yes gene_type:complete